MEITGRNNRPGFAFIAFPKIIANSKLVDPTTNGVIHNPDSKVIDETIFTDSGQTISNISNNQSTGVYTFDVTDASSFFVGMALRMASNTGRGYVVLAINSNTVTVDREIIEDSGTAVYSSSYYSVYCANRFGQYDQSLFFVIFQALDTTTGSLDVKDFDGTKITGFEFFNFNDMNVLPLSQLFITSGTAATNLLIMKSY